MRTQARVSTHSRLKAAAEAVEPVEAKQAVSTHSRLKVAEHFGMRRIARKSFNTQPPEGGCIDSLVSSSFSLSFNTQPPEGGCPRCRHADDRTDPLSFNTQPPEGGCADVCAFDGFVYFEFQHTAA